MEPRRHHHRIYFVKRLLSQNYTEEDSNILVASPQHQGYSLASLPLSFGVSDSHKSARHFVPSYLALCLSQALGILVLVRSIPHGTSTPNLSTLSSSRCLTSLRCEKPHLKAGFTLRCFQRLSLPNAATQLYGWRHNWYTVGSSTPVLSY